MGTTIEPDSNFLDDFEVSQSQTRTEANPEIKITDFIEIGNPTLLTTIMFCRHINDKNVVLDPPRAKDNLDVLVAQVLDFMAQVPDTWDPHSP